jgi:hypothetical protein
MGILVLLLIVLGFSALLLGIGILLERLIPKKNRPTAEYMDGTYGGVDYIPIDGPPHHSAIAELGHCIHIDLPSCDGFL